MERIKVLVVDDSRVSCAMLSNMMAKTNFEVCGMASNCADAVLKYESLRPMAVTMDMNQPDADGIECSRRIREIDPDARIVMISAMKDASLMERGREVGITSFLQKPVSPYELIDALSCIVSDDIKRNTSIRDLYILFAKNSTKNIFPRRKCLVATPIISIRCRLGNQLLEQCTIAGGGNGFTSHFIVHTEPRTCKEWLGVILKIGIIFTLNSNYTIRLIIQRVRSLRV